MGIEPDIEKANGAEETSDGFEFEEKAETAPTPTPTPRAFANSTTGGGGEGEKFADEGGGGAITTPAPRSGALDALDADPLATPSSHSVTFEEAERAANKTARTLSLEANAAAGAAVMSAHGPMSVVSKKYDLDGKGYLDENEKMMRQYDKGNAGTLDLREVYKIVDEVRRQQEELNKDRKKIHNLKNVIIGLVVFALLLTVSMLGVSFAAAKLAQDTVVDPNTGAYCSKDSHEPLSTISASKVYELTLVSNDTERRLFASPDSIVGDLAHRRMKALDEEDRRRSLLQDFKGGWGGRDRSGSDNGGLSPNSGLNDNDRNSGRDNGRTNAFNIRNYGTDCQEVALASNAVVSSVRSGIMGGETNVRFLSRFSQDRLSVLSSIDFKNALIDGKVMVLEYNGEECNDPETTGRRFCGVTNRAIVFGPTDNSNGIGARNAINAATNPVYDCDRGVNQGQSKNGDWN